jgi:hypothetical protein
MKPRLPNRPDRRGVSSVEFALSLLVLIPLMLGLTAIGINMIRTLETVQLARDAGHMYATGINFGQPGNKTILATIGSPLGLNTAGTGTAVVILSALAYVDDDACSAVGAVDSSGKATSACTNRYLWVFTQRVVVGNSNVRKSNLGTPTGVTVDSTTGKISQSDYVLKTGARASFSGVNPYTVAESGAVSGLPSGQVLYLAEAAATGFNMPPFVSNAVAYSFGYF